MSFVYRLAGEIHTEFLEDFLVDVTQEDGGVNLTAFQKWEGVKCLAAVLVIRAED